MSVETMTKERVSVDPAGVADLEKFEKSEKITNTG